MSDNYRVTRGSKSWTFATQTAVIKAIQNGRIDGADRIQGPGESRAVPLAQHKRLSRELIDDEVIHEEEGSLEVDLTPMIDVTFLLLIFFMATTLIVMFKTLQAPGGQSKDKGKGTRKLPTRSQIAKRYLLVTIQDDGSVAIGSQRAVGSESIRKVLEQEMKADPDKRTLVIEAGPGARHGDVVQVIDAANLAQAEKILFAKKVSAKKQ